MEMEVQHFFMFFKVFQAPISPHSVIYCLYGFFSYSVSLPLFPVLAGKGILGRTMSLEQDFWNVVFKVQTYVGGKLDLGNLICKASFL